MRPQREELLQAALRYADVWPVFRCQPGKKIPLAETAGFKDATRVRQIIEDWWRAQPYNVAIPTGIETVDVLDVDVKPEGSGWAALNVLKRAGMLAGARAMVRTRSGGLHVYFAGTDQGCGRLPRHYLDFKATGGYVLMPPSFVEADDKGPAGAYEVLDHRSGNGTLDWAAVRNLLDPPKRQSFRARPPEATGVLPPGLRDMICHDVTDSNTSGGWALTLYRAGCRYGERGASLDEALADLVGAAQPWNGHEARRAEMHVRNGWQRGSGQLEAVSQ